MTETYFFDTYALIEVLQRNPRYEPYLDAQAILTKLNVYEIAYWLLREEATDEKIVKEHYEQAIDYDEQVIADAARLKLMNKKLSMTDCIGYCLARRLDVKFLTGDIAFKGMKGVEWVK